MNAYVAELKRSLDQVGLQQEVRVNVESKALECLDADLREQLEQLIPDRRTMLDMAVQVQTLRLLQKLCDGNDSRKEGGNG